MVESKENINQVLDNFANNSIKVMSEALAEKDVIIKIWRERTFKLSAKNRQCFYCLSDKDWIPETMICRPCWEKEERNK